MFWIIGFVLVGVALFDAYVRLAPSHPSVWHQPAPPELSGYMVPDWQTKPPADLVVPRENGAFVQFRTSNDVTLESGIAPGVDPLRRLDAIALATPRTTRLAGSPESGMITWVTRSALWGFPDYTTAQAIPTSMVGQLIEINARQRFGKADLGVNAARLREWVGHLEPLAYDDLLRENPLIPTQP